MLVKFSLKFVLGFQLKTNWTNSDIINLLTCVFILREWTPTSLKVHTTFSALIRTFLTVASRKPLADVDVQCKTISDTCKSWHWRHNDHDGVSNHQPHGCLLNRLFRRRSKKTSKLLVTGLCAGNSPGPVNSPHKRPVTRKMFPFDDVIVQTVQGS